MKVILTEEQLHKIAEGIVPNMIINNKDIGYKILNKLKSTFSFSDEQIIGIGASMYQECRFNPNAKNGQSSAYGIGQWTTNYAGKFSRQVFMCAYLNIVYGTKYIAREPGDSGPWHKGENGSKSPTSIPLDYQIEWMVRELKGISGKGACSIAGLNYQEELKKNPYNQGKYTWKCYEVNQVVPKIKAARTAEEACDIWTELYERTPDLEVHRARIPLIRQMFQLKK